MPRVPRPYDIVLFPIYALVVIAFVVIWASAFAIIAGAVILIVTLIFCAFRLNAKRLQRNDELRQATDKEQRRLAWEQAAAKRAASNEDSTR